MNRHSRPVLSWVAYPILTSIVLISALVMMSNGLPLLASTYVPVAIAAFTVTLLEFFNPARSEWKPNRSDVLNDLLFMAIVQLALPKVVAFLVLIATTKVMQGNGFYAQLWPGDWPIPLQALLMVVLADFFRYWLHRAAHGHPWLWALHKVHHAPRVLYWVNVGRFHPIEKAIQICVDSLPFILIGVSEPVLALYFVFYATNGFLQHSNVYLQHGLLNHVFSTAELPRWHHARDSSTASCNFGNNLIIWDTLFGTRYLPTGQQVSAIGIADEDYPTDFRGQLKAPFARSSASRVASNRADVSRDKRLSTGGAQ